MALKSVWPLLKKTFDDFDKDNCSIFAAALAYYALVSLVPLLMLGISVVGFVLGSSDVAMRRVLEFVTTVMPTATEYVRSLMSSVIESRGVVSGLGLLGLLWSGSQMFFVLEQAMDIAWHAPQRRSWVKSRVLALVMVLAIGLFMALSFGSTLLVGVIKGLQTPIWGLRPSQLPFIWPIVGFLLPLLVTMIMFTALYKFTPNRKVPWKSAFVGGLLTSFLFEGAKVGFAYYVANFGNFDKVYGSIAGVIGFVFWSFYGASVVLLGAEFASEFDQMILGRKHAKAGADIPVLRRQGRASS